MRTPVDESQFATYPTAVDPTPTVCDTAVSTLNVTSEILPPPSATSFSEVNETALDLVRFDPARFLGFFTTPTLAKSLPTIKSGFDVSF